MFSPIQIPSFITKQIILDIVEMVEKGDIECAHLGIIFLSYLRNICILLSILSFILRILYFSKMHISVLVSLSYLMDFLIAVDFLCCDKLKAGVEEKIKEKIDETNWREVLAYTKDIIGLENTTKAALETIIK